MKNAETNDIAVQGAEQVTEKTRKASTQRALEGLKNNIKALEEANLLDGAELETMKKIQQRAVEKWIKDKFKF